jgi:predicted dehydrogenase
MIKDAFATIGAAATPFNVAFLGGAHSSAVGRTHRVAIEMDRRFKLVAGCFSRNAEANICTAQQYGVLSDRTYASLDHLLEREAGQIDAVHILTPTDQHMPQVLQCIRAGVPVICEKALANSSAEAEEIREELKKRDGFLAVTFNYLGYPMLRELKSMVEQNVFGKIQQLHIEMPQEGFSRVTHDGKPIVPQDWRLRDGIVPTISLDLGVHLHMIARYLTGEKPLKVVASSDTYGNFPQIIDNVSCIAKYSNNLHCNIWYSKTIIGQRNGLKLRLLGEKGSADWIQENPEQLFVADNLGRRYMVDRASSEVKVCNQARYTRFKAGHPAGFIEAFANYYSDVADSLALYLRQQRPFANADCFGVQEALEGLYLLEAISASSKSQSWVAVKCA